MGISLVQSGEMRIPPSFFSVSRVFLGRTTYFFGLKSRDAEFMQ